MCPARARRQLKVVGPIKMLIVTQGTQYIMLEIPINPRGCYSRATQHNEGYEAISWTRKQPHGCKSMRSIQNYSTRTHSHKHNVRIHISLIQTHIHALDPHKKHRHSHKDTSAYIHRHKQRRTQLFCKNVTRSPPVIKERAGRSHVLQHTSRFL